MRTLVEDVSEDGGGVDSAAVPATVGELVLTLDDREEGAGLDGLHQVEVAATQLALTLDEATLFAAARDVVETARAS